MPPESEPIMAMLTTHANRAFLPEESGQLIIQPVQTQSVALAAAKSIFTGEQIDHYRVPIVAQDPSAQWIGEGEEITPSDQTLDEEASGFYKLAGLTIISRELAEDSSPAAADMVGYGLARDIARKLDAAFFGTKGVSTVQPRGLEDLTTSTIDAGEEWANIDPFTAAIYGAEELGAPLTSFVANPADALALATVKKATGSNEPLLGNDPTQPTRRTIAGVPLLVSPAVTAGTVWGIPRDRSLLVLRENVRLDIDHSVYFTSDRVAVKATIRATTLWPHPAAIQKISLSAGNGGGEGEGEGESE